MEETKLKMVIEAENKANKVFKELNDSVEEHKKRLKDLTEVSKKVATAGTIAFGAIAGAIGFSVKQAIEMESIQNRLYEILKTTNKATKEQVDVLLDQAEAIEKVGVMSKENIIMAQSQLATFDLQIDTIKQLTPAIMDYVVAEKGMSATTEDVKALTNGLAQALQGNFGSLTRVGFVLDDVTKKMISEGTEIERAQALTEVLNSTYKDFNITAKDTAEGSLIVLQRTLGDISEEIGIVFLPVLNDLVKQLTPVIEKVVDWIKENPELTKNIVLIAGAIAGLVAVIGMLGLALPAIITVIGTLGAALPAIIAGFTFLTGPIGAVIVALTALGVAVMLIKDNWKGALETMKTITETILIKIKTFFLNLKLKIIEIIDGIRAKIQPVIDMVSGVANTASNIGSSIGGAVSGVFGQAKSFLLGSRENGGYIPQTGPYLLHEGEYVVPKSDSSGVNITFNFNGDVSDIDTLQKKIIETLNRNATLKSFAGQ